MARSAFKMKGSPMQRNFGIGGSPLTKPTEPTKEELVAMADAKFGDNLKVKQVSDKDYKAGERDYKARRSFQSDTWSSLSDAKKKAQIESTKNK